MENTDLGKGHIHPGIGKGRRNQGFHSLRHFLRAGFIIHIDAADGIASAAALIFLIIAVKNLFIRHAVVGKRRFEHSLIKSISVRNTGCFAECFQGFPIRELADDLRFTEGAKFFDPARNDVFPQGDFALCVDADAYGCAIRITKDDNGLLVSTPVIP